MYPQVLVILLVVHGPNALGQLRHRSGARCLVAQTLSSSIRVSYGPYEHCAAVANINSIKVAISEFELSVLMLKYWYIIN